MKLIEKNSKDELAPFRETIDSWLLILVGEDPRPIYQKIQENGGKITFAQYKYDNYWPNNYLRFKEWIERYIIVNNELPSGVHCIEQRQINIYSFGDSYVDFDVPEKIYPEDNDDIMIAEEKKEKLLEPFRPTIDSWIEHIVGKEPEDMFGHIFWRINYIHVQQYIENYIKDNNELPSGVHFIVKFDDSAEGTPEGIGNKGFVNFDECPKSTI
jgi:hypothetical protein